VSKDIRRRAVRSFVTATSFLLLAGVANVALSNSQPFHRAQRVASALILVAPPLLMAAFFIDPARGLYSSTVFRLGMYSFWIAGILLAIDNCRGRSLRGRLTMLD